MAAGGLGLGLAAFPPGFDVEPGVVAVVPVGRVDTLVKAVFLKM